MNSRVLQKIPTVGVTAYRLRGFHCILRAYGFGALSFLTPRLLGLLIAKIRRNKNKKKGNAGSCAEIARILRESLRIHRFPTFCGFTVAVFYLLQSVLENLFASYGNRGNNYANKPTLLSWQAATSFFVSTLAGAGGLTLLNSKQTGDAGRTIDLTLFTLVRATDVIVGELWQRRKDRRGRSGKFTRIESLIGSLADPAVFALSAACVMYAWIYTPEKLPPSYSKQLTNIANVDQRLVIALQKIRCGDFIYGVDTGQGHLLESYCEEVGLPKRWGNPTQTVPIPCEVVHGAQTRSCEVNAIQRFWAATWKTAFPIYLGLNALRFVRLRKPRVKALLSALWGAARSSAFLGLFVSIFWYSICLTRTRLGPKLLPLKRLALENLAVKIGCVLCGWSILLENAHRRTEIMFFVAPRALALVVPRRYDRKYQWIETTTFAISTGILLATIKHKPKRVRGVFGKLLGKVLTE
ncbi:hypothetical protein BDD12DRAFT_881520 [Trichophaea hybrida]|nr:hypothetical protein BDD12DRAFT_881520 [Trichophaea hybrida]